jgi:hypothetical protein
MEPDETIKLKGMAAVKNMMFNSRSFVLGSHLHSK